MNDVKYQVFVSSTYEDLAEVRRDILNILLLADCIPAGMENFTAKDDEQFSVIKRVIDLCDYYILIIGKRYGSINSETGISYSEMEYEYAIEKGIPVLVFALDENADVELNGTDEDDIKKGKLAQFRAKAMTNRLACIWKNQTELMGQVAISIMTAKSEVARPGWHRGPDAEVKNILLENKRLRDRLSDIESNGKRIVDSVVFEEKLKNQFYGKKVIIHFTESAVGALGKRQLDQRTVDTTMDELFKHISVRLTGVHPVNGFKKAISSFQDGYYIDTQEALVLKNRYEQLNLIRSYLNDENTEMVELTEQGREIMNKLNMI